MNFDKVASVNYRWQNTTEKWSRKHLHTFPTPRHYLRPSAESFVLKFKSTLQSVFYTRALAILIVHKAPNSFYYYALPLRYWVLHISPQPFLLTF